MKQYTEPAKDPDGDERHPAFGVVTLHRISSTGATLFQSDVQHPEFLRVEVHEASRKRDLHHDWVHPERVICEFSMSLAQFASFVASTGQGGGIPCTIEYATAGTHEPGERPGLRPATRLALTHDEVRAAADKAFEDIKVAEAHLEAVLAGKSTAAERKRALADLRAAVANATPNVEFAAKSLDRHAEAVVELARADIEAMARLAGERPEVQDVVAGRRAAIEGGAPQ